MWLDPNPTPFKKWKLSIAKLGNQCESYAITIFARLNLIAEEDSTMLLQGSRIARPMIFMIEEITPFVQRFDHQKPIAPPKGVSARFLLWM
jgi:hypothetical protein